MEMNSHSKHPCDAVQKLQISPSLLFGVATRREAVLSAFVYHCTIIIHTGNLGLSERILPVATSSVDEAGAHFLALLFLTYNKKTLLFFPSPWFSLKSWQYIPSLPVVLIMRSCLRGGTSFSSSPSEGLQGGISFPFKNYVVHCTTTIFPPPNQFKTQNFGSYSPSFDNIF